MQGFWSIFYIVCVATFYVSKEADCFFHAPLTLPGKELDMWLQLCVWITELPFQKHRHHPGNPDREREREREWRESAKAEVCVCVNERCSTGFKDPSKRWDRHTHATLKLCQSTSPRLSRKLHHLGLYSTPKRCDGLSVSKTAQWKRELGILYVEKIPVFFQSSPGLHHWFQMQPYKGEEVFQPFMSCIWHHTGDVG